MFYFIFCGKLRNKKNFCFHAFFRRRIQSQHNLLEKELADHTIDILKYSNIRIIEKVSGILKNNIMEIMPTRTNLFWFFYPLSHALLR